MSGTKSPDLQPTSSSTPTPCRTEKQGITTTHQPALVKESESSPNRRSEVSLRAEQNTVSIDEEWRKSLSYRGPNLRKSSSKPLPLTGEEEDRVPSPAKRIPRLAKVADFPLREKKGGTGPAQLWTPPLKPPDHLLKKNYQLLKEKYQLQMDKLREDMKLQQLNVEIEQRKLESEQIKLGTQQLKLESEQLKLQFKTKNLELELQTESEQHKVKDQQLEMQLQYMQKRQVTLCISLGILAIAIAIAMLIFVILWLMGKI
ncbi:hypothetical protein K491DRAFT_685369 [Lophiostoma macrostomum CBS 122681]|uniref:Uncharacterized protein n=1 Tax=Lophiostoma macrostomum CBS 122681 TaxID=1314788 RepID=A0A6A6SKZ8_9PLEO|nr:hypothetical protein K491DRAFT_685369 [Lophiostoma macrostomum CBS 122681]